MNLRALHLNPSTSKSMNKNTVPSNMAGMMSTESTMKIKGMDMVMNRAMENTRRNHFWGIFLILAKLVRQAFGGLMDESSLELLDEISSLLSKNRKDTWIDLHRLLAWRAGSQIRVDFHLVLPA
jgi:hypothetical protein